MRKKIRDLEHRSEHCCALVNAFEVRQPRGEKLSSLPYFGVLCSLFPLPAAR